jgi:hypothetical protein
MLQQQHCANATGISTGLFAQCPAAAHRLLRSWPLLDSPFDAFGAAQSALSALWPADGQGVPWPLLFLVLLFLASLYEAVVLVTDALAAVQPLPACN